MTERPPNAFSRPSSPRSVVPALRWARPRRAVILAYHGIADLTRATDPLLLTIPAHLLYAQVEALGQAGFRFVTVAQLAETLESGSSASGLVALSFDDGLLNNFEFLLGLAERGIPAAVYPVTGWIGGRHPRILDAKESRMLTEDHLRALADAGVEIGGHTTSHRDLSTLSFSDCLSELAESRATLESIVGRPVRTLAYPFGRHSAAAREAAREAGFYAAVAEDGQGIWDRFEIPRAPVHRTQGWGVFTLKVTGAWPAFKRSVPGRAARAATRRIRRKAELRREGEPAPR
jgi:peptidoglycan/xylan/chitin deacetylase (PgdA/CDA1 family)